MKAAAAGFILTIGIVIGMVLEREFPIAVTTWFFYAAGMILATLPGVWLSQHMPKDAGRARADAAEQASADS